MLKGLLLLNTLLFSIIGFSQQVDSCQVMQPNADAGKDAMLHGLASVQNDNFGSSEQFPASTWTFAGDEGTIRSVIDFDLSAIPQGATITSADLTLFAWDNAGGLGPHSPLSGPNNGWIQRITSPWDEAMVTWNTQPSTTSTNQVGIPASVSASDDYIIDVSTLIVDMINNPSNSYGFMLLLDDETIYRRLNFCSSDHVDPNVRPMLEVCYSYNVGIEEIDEFDFMLYPNPSDGNFTVSVNEYAMGARIEIVSLTGQVINSTELNDSTTSYQMNILQTGIYFVRVHKNGLTSSQKLIVK